MAGDLAFVLPDIAEDQQRRHAPGIVQHIAAVPGNDGEGMGRALGIKNGIQIKLLAGSAAGGLPVKDHAAVRLAAGILAGVRGLRVGRGDDLALSGRGDGHVRDHGLRGMIRLDEHAAGGALMACLIVSDERDFDGFPVRKLAGIQHAQLLGGLLRGIRPDRYDLAGGAGGGQRPIQQGNVCNIAPDIQHARDHRTVRRGEQLHLGRGDVHIELVLPGGAVAQRVRQMQGDRVLAVRQRGDVDLLAAGFRDLKGHEFTAVDGIVHLREAAISIRRALPTEGYAFRVRPAHGVNRGSKKRGRAAVDPHGGGSCRAFIARDVHAAHGVGMLAVCKSGNVQRKARAGLIREIRREIRPAVYGIFHPQQIVDIRNACPCEAGAVVLCPFVRQNGHVGRGGRRFVHIQLYALGRAVVARAVRAAHIHGMGAVRESGGVQREGAVGGIVGGVLPRPGRRVRSGWIDNVLHMARAQCGGVSRLIRDTRPGDGMRPGTRPVSRADADRGGLAGRRGIRQESRYRGGGSAAGRLAIRVGGHDPEIIIQVALTEPRNIGQLLTGAVPMQGILARGDLLVGGPEIFPFGGEAGGIAHKLIFILLSVVDADGIPACPAHLVPAQVYPAAFAVGSIAMGCGCQGGCANAGHIGGREIHAFVAGQHIRRTDARPCAARCYGNAIVLFLIRRVKPRRKEPGHIQAVPAGVKGNVYADFTGERGAAVIGHGGCIPAARYQRNFELSIAAYLMNIDVPHGAFNEQIRSRGEF